MLQPFVHGIINTLIRFAYPKRDAGRILLDEADSPIGRGPVYDDIFDVRIRLAEDAQNGTLQPMGGIIGYGYDSKLRRCIHDYVVFMSIQKFFYMIARAMLDLQIDFPDVFAGNADGYQNQTPQEPDRYHQRSPTRDRLAMKPGI